ncbi:MAG TPA: nuclear transport factor 2 family protein [Actinomycetes bacterium]|jgi:hypothetical protein|nr:nuclear transport factor 2 family protein [Actinomycetes bacterium]
MDAYEAARRWSREWEAGWRDRDAESIGKLYAKHAQHHPTPFRPAIAMVDYVVSALEGESDADPVFGTPVVQGDRAVVEYWATLLEGGEPVTIAGCSFLRFDADGLVTEQRDYWHQRDGHQQPWPGWGE